MSLSDEALRQLLEGPALAPPPGMHPNFIDPPNLQSQIRAVEILTLLLATLAVATRIYTKARILKRVASEDYLCFLSWALYVAIYIPTILGSNATANRHQWDVKLKDMKDFLFYKSIVVTMYGFVVLAMKTSILIQYIKIFSMNKRKSFYWTCHALIWLNVVFYLTLSFLEIFACSPREKIWTPWLPGGKCLRVREVNVSAAAVNVVSDFVMVLLPQRHVWKLKISTRSRLGISLAFATAILASICAAVRLKYAVIYLRHDDFTWLYSQMAIWMFLELGIGIVACCLPTLPRFFKALAEKPLFSSISSTLHSFLSPSNRNNSNESTSPSTVQGHKSSARHITHAPSESYEELEEDFELPIQKPLPGQTRVHKASV
ncbi:hypothetical protein HYFRA_00014135 [Hymenoscyphus fraxineus]|uniref:Rhodopsin domain-containing protein n=1 Tax=Hymenoscyphus fraxineus TaxID=746836 RepID=A0A9N9LBK3_9HELO|nr:hypothetical protein HYFRA_00014135 [Hymenoscyphus fraxineus]